MKRDITVFYASVRLHMVKMIKKKISLKIEINEGMEIIKIRGWRCLIVDMEETNH